MMFFYVLTVKMVSSGPPGLVESYHYCHPPAEHILLWAKVTRRILNYLDCTVFDLCGPFTEGFSYLFREIGLGIRKWSVKPVWSD